MFGFRNRTRALLAAIRASSNVSAAARSLGTTPSTALRHLQAAEQREGGHLVERARGGRNGGAARLTPLGRSLLEEGAERTEWAGVADSFEPDEGVTTVLVGRRIVLVAGRVPSGPVRLSFRPEDVTIELPRRETKHGESLNSWSSARNEWSARVEQCAGQGEGIVAVNLGLSEGYQLRASVTRGAVRDLRLRAGRRVVVRVKATAVVAQPRMASGWHERPPPATRDRRLPASKS